MKRDKSSKSKSQISVEKSDREATQSQSAVTKARDTSREKSKQQLQELYGNNNNNNNNNNNYSLRDQESLLSPKVPTNNKKNNNKIGSMVVIKQSQEKKQIEDPQALKQKLLEQNSHLRNELNELEEAYKSLEKKFKSELLVPGKKVVPRREPKNAEELEYKKELDSVQGKIFQYQKEIRQMKNKIESNQAFDKLLSLSLNMKSRQVELKQLEDEIRVLEQIGKQQEGSIGLVHNEEENKTREQQAKNDIKGLKEEIKKLVEQDKEELIKAKIQQEYLVVLETKFREMCDKAGIKATANPNKIDTNSLPSIKKPKDNNNNNSNTSIEEKTKNVSGGIKTNKRENIKDSVLRHAMFGGTDDFNEKIDPNDVTESNFESKKQEAKECRTKFLETDKLYKTEEQQINSEIWKLRTDNDVLEKRLWDKEKYNQIAREIKFTTKVGLIDRKELSKKEDEELNLSDVEKMEEIVDDIEQNTKQNNQQQQVREVKAGKKTQDQLEFSDRTLLESNQSTRICQIKLWIDKENRINGIQVFYRTPDGRKIKGNQYLSKFTQQYLIETVDFDSDFLKKISLSFHKDDTINSISFTSSNNKVKRIGRDTLKTEQPIDIQEDEIPICILGALKPLKDVSGKEIGSLLCQLGAEVVKEEVEEKIEVDKNDTENTKSKKK